jgi:hypothetical protein
VQTSFVVQVFPSLQAVPSATAGLEHVPVLELQVPTAWHWSLAVHRTGFEPVHVPPWHAYVCSHLFVPVHAVPSAAVGLEQVPVLGLQVPAT